MGTGERLRSLSHSLKDTLRGDKRVMRRAYHISIDRKKNLIDNVMAKDVKVYQYLSFTLFVGKVECVSIKILNY